MLVGVLAGESPDAGACLGQGSVAGIRLWDSTYGTRQRWESNSSFTVRVSLEAAGAYLHCFIAFMAD
jgi:hypothetical protein